MEYDIALFTERLKSLILMSNAFPYMRNEDLDKAKHPKRQPLHLKQALDESATIEVGGNTIRTFDFGNETLEQTHPYYHILENAPVIKKAGKGTKKTKGSQAKVEVGKRDYEKVSWNGKTFVKEYNRNVRGKRNRITNVSHWTEDYMGRDVFINREANAYLNRHYKYIENILDGSVVDQLALEFSMKVGRKMDTGLGEEYSMQEESNYTTDIISILDSFNLGE